MNVSEYDIFEIIISIKMQPTSLRDQVRMKVLQRLGMNMKLSQILSLMKFLKILVKNFPYLVEKKNKAKGSLREKILTSASQEPLINSLTSQNMDQEQPTPPKRQKLILRINMQLEVKKELQKF